MTDPFITGHSKYGIFGGVMTILIVNISSGDIARTMILAATGACVSFGMSVGLRYCLRKWRR